MKPLQRFALLSLTICGLTGATGCASNPNHTHRGNLLDDKVTIQRVQAALKRAGQEFQYVTVTVNDGEVTLSGKVKTDQLRQRAEEIAKSTDRVTAVKDELQVGP